MSLDALNNMSYADLRRAMKAKAVVRKIVKLEAEIDVLNKAILLKAREASKLRARAGKMVNGMFTSAPKPSRKTGKSKRVKNSKSLREVMVQVLRRAKKPMPAAKIAEAVMRGGFKTSSKNPQTFKCNVANVLRLSAEFVKRGGKYTLRPKGK
jgi:hypothetical protein